MTSSAYSLSAAFPADGFEVIRGEPVIGGLHGAESHHYFCPHCMSWMFTRNEGLEWFVNIRATLFDETGWFEPYLETWLSEKLPWVEPVARHGFDALPPMEAFDGLIKGYCRADRWRLKPLERRKPRRLTARSALHAACANRSVGRR